MLTEISDTIPDSCTLLALGEPTHGEPAFARLRNDILEHLAETRGFCSILLETDRINALMLNDYVLHGTGNLEDVMEHGFTHDFGRLPANRDLVVRLRDHNRDLPDRDKISLLGFDAPTEMASAPSPATYLDYVCDYLGQDATKIDDLAGDEQAWSRPEAVMDSSQSPGRSSSAAALHDIVRDLSTELYIRAPSSSPPLPLMRGARLGHISRRRPDFSTTTALRHARWTIPPGGRH